MFYFKKGKFKRKSNSKFYFLEKQGKSWLKKSLHFEALLKNFLEEATAALERQIKFSGLCISEKHCHESAFVQFVYPIWGLL